MFLVTVISTVIITFNFLTIKWIQNLILAKLWLKSKVSSNGYGSNGYYFFIIMYIKKLVLIKLSLKFNVFSNCYGNGNYNF